MEEFSSLKKPQIFIALTKKNDKRIFFGAMQRGLRSDFFSTKLLFLIFIWTFISFFYFDFYFPFLFGLFLI